MVLCMRTALKQRTEQPPCEGRAVDRRRLGFLEGQLAELAWQESVYGGDYFRELGLDLWPTGGGQNENGQPSPGQNLLVLKVLIGGDEHLEGRLRSLQQGAVVESLPAHFIGRRDRVAC